MTNEGRGVNVASEIRGCLTLLDASEESTDLWAGCTACKESTDRGLAVLSEMENRVS